MVILHTPWFFFSPPVPPAFPSSFHLYFVRPGERLITGRDIFLFASPAFILLQRGGGSSGLIRRKGEQTKEIGSISQMMGSPGGRNPENPDFRRKTKIVPTHGI
jgi:hypothetical protein